MAPTALSYNATIIERNDFSDKLASFRVRLDEEQEIAPWFEAGQYLVIGLNNEEKPELGSVRRPMSIASGPYARDAAEFYIRLVSPGTSSNPLTPLLWQTKAGDRIYVKPTPNGHFTLQQTIGLDPTRHKVLVAAGTGLAPFLSMARERAEIRPHGSKMDDLAILHGASFSHDLGYFEELYHYQREFGLKYLPTVSRPDEDPSWHGPTGRVEDFFLPERIDDTFERLKLTRSEFGPDSVSLMVCGLTGTIAATLERLLPYGFVPDNNRIRRALEIPEDATSTLYFEQYDAEPVVNIKDPDNVARLRRLWHERALAV